MGRQDDKHSTVTYSGDRTDIDLEVISDDPTASRIVVQCTACGGRFSIGRTSMRNERLMARNFHCGRPPSSEATGQGSTIASKEDGAKSPQL